MIAWMKKLIGWLFPKPKREMPDAINDRFPSFWDFVRAMDSPLEVAHWIQSFTVYDLSKNLGWGQEPVDGEHFDDLMASLAYSLWKRKGGACGNYMAMFVVCAREHGLECGGMVDHGHARGWILFDGVICITDNKTITRTEMRDKAALMAKYKSGIFVDENYKVVRNGHNAY